ncbi:MAG: hypothetical protein H6Q13_726 [Bacteroidetes bacterium]|jgi:hypothetical protein|nr:hypothetical protein [Bacteroidota bacterium]
MTNIENLAENCFLDLLIHSFLMNNKSNHEQFFKNKLIAFKNKSCL